MISYNEGVTKLIKMGKKNQGSLTFKEVNDVLPNSPIFLDKIENIIDELSKEGIELVDETRKKVSKKNKIIKKEKPTKKFTNKRYYDDPVRMYLGEMGRVPLLDREGEVRIAKKIENGQQQINKYIFFAK